MFSSIAHPTGPSFVLARPDRVIESFGTRKSFTNPHTAADALRAGEVSALVGALAFDPVQPCALAEPRELRHQNTRWTYAPAPGTSNTRGRVGAAIFEPDDATHALRVRDLLEVIDQGRLEKIVLSRKALVTSIDPLNPHEVLGRLVDADANGNGYLVDLGGDVLVGSSPEVLIRRQGTTVSCHPLAGSARRNSDPERDARIGANLLASTKDRHEHAFVVEAIRKALAPLCSDLDIADAPTLTTTPQLWHLGTPVTGVLSDPRVTALDLALAIHPTPAVNGTPFTASLEELRRIEPDRGFYAGAVGWCDSNGDGEWIVAIRCARISADRLSATAYAGGGIVAGSDPKREVSETLTKFRTVLAALGSDSSNLEW
ncbi:MAG: isochorismate synthase [Rhodococcus sp.]|nr:isochorismate synthase [Rhodococcus sp. (in: high G+C Gram-positive bacteria)]